MPLVTLFLSGTPEHFASPGAARALLHVLDQVRDPFLADGKAPMRAKAMDVHRFAVPETWQRAPRRYCTYVVGYEGPADDQAAWLTYYLKHHRPLEWRCPSHLRRVRHLQRNKVAFDGGATLAAALDSPVPREMRADFARFPPYRGRVTHYAMSSEVLAP